MSIESIIKCVRVCVRDVCLCGCVCVGVGYFCLTGGLRAKLARMAGPSPKTVASLIWQPQHSTFYESELPSKDGSFVNCSEANYDGVRPC